MAAGDVAAPVDLALALRPDALATHGLLAREAAACENLGRDVDRENARGDEQRQRRGGDEPRPPHAAYFGPHPSYLPRSLHLFHSTATLEVAELPMLGSRAIYRHP